MTAPLIYINFHGIGEPQRPIDADEAHVWVARETFLKILDRLQGRPNVRITFDDGNASDVAVALPALMDRDLTATFFVVADRLDQSTYLTRSDLRQLREAGMGIGCHGMRHQPWRGLSPAELTEELKTAREQIEAALGEPVLEAACPFGSYDRRVVSALRREGYSKVYTSDRGVAHHHAWLVPRNTVHRDDTPDQVVACLQMPSATQQAVQRVKQLLKRWR